MRFNLVFLLIFLVLLGAKADIEIYGVYQGKNVYVQNPFTSNMKDYCTKEVYVNDVKLMTEIHASAYEIDLSFLPVNEPVTIRITHKEDCNPKILNPQVVKIQTTFAFNSVNMEKRQLSWATKNEHARGRYFIERYEYSHWKILNEIYSSGAGRYVQPITHNSGSNKYRIKYLDERGNAIYSDVLDYESDNKPITIYPKRVTDILYLSDSVYYQVLDKYGNEISKGVKKEVNLERLPSDVYYLNVDNRTYKFFKK